MDIKRLNKEVDKRIKRLAFENKYQSGKWYSGRVTEIKPYGNMQEIWVSVDGDDIVGAFNPSILNGISKGNTVQVQIYESGGGRITRIEKIRK